MEVVDVAASEQTSYVIMFGHVLQRIVDLLPHSWDAFLPFLAHMPTANQPIL